MIQDIICNSPFESNNLGKGEMTFWHLGEQGGAETGSAIGVTEGALIQTGINFTTLYRTCFHAYIIPASIPSLISIPFLHNA